MLWSIQFEIEFNFTRIQDKRQYDFQRQPLELLLKLCDGEEKDILEKSSAKEREKNIKYAGFAATEIKGRIVINLVKEAMCLEYAKVSL